MDEYQLPIQFALGQRYEFPPSDARARPSPMSPTRHHHRHGSPDLLLHKIAVVWHTPVPLTQAQLARKRDEFWETAPTYGGLPEVWQAIREAAKVGQYDMETARMILRCAGVTTPRGTLIEAYDERGYRYSVPPYCLCDPAEGMAPDREISPNECGETELSPKDHDAKAKDPPLELRVRLSLGYDEQLSLPNRPDLCIQHVRHALGQRLTAAGRIEFFWAGHGPLPPTTRLSSLQSDSHSTLLQAWILPLEGDRHLCTKFG